MTDRLIKEVEKKVKQKIVNENKKVVFNSKDFIQVKPNKLKIKKMKKNVKNKKIGFINVGSLNENKNNCTIVGKSLQLEKNYYRLKGEPNEDEIRNEQVLKKALNFVLRKFKKNKDYAYLCDQLKAIRQDLTIQHINNDFTVLVYKIHAKYSVQHKDISEFNQCINMLMKLFKTLKYPIEDDSVLQFTSYQLLYTLYVNSLHQFRSIIESLPENVKENKFIQFSLNIAKAYYGDDLFTFFSLYKQSSKTTKKILNSFVERMQFKGIQMICLTYRPSISVETIKKELCFDDTSFNSFVTKHNIILNEPHDSIMAVETMKNLSTKSEE